MNMPEFMHPQALWLLLLLIPLIVWHMMRRKKAPTLAMSSALPFAGVSGGWKSGLRHVLFGMRCAAIVCLIIVIARPMSFDSWSKSRVEGTDIVIALDISGSMQAADLGKENRLKAAKRVAKQFVNGRENDNMGLVLFAGESFSAVPLTSDRTMLANYLDAVTVNQIAADGTAIGDGIASAINRIKDGTAVSKSIILITDGTNNKGIVAPETAAEIAKDMGIKIYTVGVGALDRPQTVQYLDDNDTFLGMAETDPVDFSALQRISSLTGGKYFAAKSKTALGEIFHEIDQLEKTKFDVRNFSHAEDTYIIWAWLAFGLYGLQLLLKLTIGRSIP